MDKKKIIERAVFNDRGLIPAILQDVGSGEVLMLAYMNQEALQMTLETGKATFWSRSRQRLWVKGETSGNIQYLKDISLDCDDDTLLLKVKPAGPACHTGHTSCFYRSSYPELNFFYRLNQVIKDRQEKLPEDSYTTSLFQKGRDRIIQKVGEEAVEVLIAAKNEEREEIKAETADLIYHLLVMLTDSGLELADIEDKLRQRHK